MTPGVSRRSRWLVGLALLMVALGACSSRSAGPVIYNANGEIITAMPAVQNGGVGGGAALAPQTDSQPTEVIDLPTREPADAIELATATSRPVDIAPAWTATPLVPQGSAPDRPNLGSTPGSVIVTPADVQAQLNLPPQMPVPVSIRPEDHFWFQRPIDSNIVSEPHPYYRYGSTYFGAMSVHAGVDLDANIGTPVRAAGPGVVVWVGYGLYGTNPPENDPYGLAVAIEHSFGFNGQKLYTLYAHMSQVDVWQNQQVQAGDLLGLSGNTGNSTGPHLHFEVRVGENKYRATRNPELWLAPRVGWGTLAGRLLDAEGRYIAEQQIEVRSADGKYYLMWTYGDRTANRDERYLENFVLADLPAGRYTLRTWVGDQRLDGEIEIIAGQTSFILMQVGNPSDYVWRSASPQATNGPNPNAVNNPTRTPSPTVALPTITPTP